MNWFKNLKKTAKGDVPISEDKFYIISGSHNKPVVTKNLIDFFSGRKNSEGFLYIGYPLIGTVEGAFAVDGMLISKQHGLIVFDLVESNSLGNYKERQDDIYLRLQSYLLQYKTLTDKRELVVKPIIITLAPRCTIAKIDSSYPFLTDVNQLNKFLSETKWVNGQFYHQLHSVIQNITTIRSGKNKRNPKKDDSRGSILKRLEDSIANLDHSQADAVINTYEGIQRIRGLAGSGKTIVLALKVAYLHAINPDWDIAVTFNTRSLKNQFEDLITRFVTERTKQEPDWDKISIIHAWGAPGDKKRGGIYYNFCKEHGEEFHDFSRAKAKFGNEDALSGICTIALNNQKGKIKPKYDAILVDEAQDFASGSSSSFLMLCYELLREPKRLVYAYDELQSLSMKGMPSPEEIFGNDSSGSPKIKSGQFSDVVLYKCYRNSRPLLATAHALGFGVYFEKGLIQMFADNRIWSDIGYNVCSGELEKGKQVALERTEETSPKFLEQLQPKNDLISFREFKDNDEQIEFLVNDIIKNISEEELLPRDIMVIHSDPVTTQQAVSKAREKLFSKGYNSNLAGVSTSPDIFQEKDAITFTGIYRAKGNEAGMVYILNAQNCYDGYSLARKRNILFTAMTRSKAWVHVLGHGEEMKKLCQEYGRIQQKDYRLEFKYPTEEEMKKMNLLHRDRDPEAERELKSTNNKISSLVTSLEKGDLDINDLDPETLKKLRAIIGAQ